MSESKTMWERLSEDTPTKHAERITRISEEAETKRIALVQGAATKQKVVTERETTRRAKITMRQAFWESPAAAGFFLVLAGIVIASGLCYWSWLGHKYPSPPARPEACVESVDIVNQGARARTECPIGARMIVTPAKDPEHITVTCKCGSDVDAGP